MTHRRWIWSNSTIGSPLFSVLHGASHNSKNSLNDLTLSRAPSRFRKMPTDVLTDWM